MADKDPKTQKKAEHVAEPPQEIADDQADAVTGGNRNTSWRTADGSAATVFGAKLGRF